MKSLDFMIVGVQKGGTSALSHFLAQHSQLAMASGKEVHLFDASDYSADWSVDDINQRYGPYFTDANPHQLWGEATPIYLYWPEIAAQLHRYSPSLKLVVLLRDPVERAVSHYMMELGRGTEHRPFWLALLLERMRLGRGDKRGVNSASRCHSYRQRGLYAQQLANLRNYFSDEQILILENRELVDAHQQTLQRVCDFLGVSCENLPEPEAVFAGDYDKSRWSVGRWLLRWSYRNANVRLKRQLNAMGYGFDWPWLR